MHSLSAGGDHVKQCSIAGINDQLRLHATRPATWASPPP
jgi:hypothetical protein